MKDRVPVWKKSPIVRPTFLWIFLIVVALGAIRVVVAKVHMSMNLDLFLQIASIALTVLLAAVGVEMANHPPTSRQERIAYRVVFSTLGLLLIATTCWQWQRNADEQNKLKIEAQTEQRKLEDRLGDLKSQNHDINGRLAAIGNFVKHPPVSLTPEQVAASIRAMAFPGNIKERAITLSDDIMKDLCRHGWPGIGGHLLDKCTSGEKFPSSADQKATADWVYRRSEMFRSNFLTKIRDVRNQMAEFDVQGEELNRFLESEKNNEELKNRKDAGLLPKDIYIPEVTPTDIEMVANELRTLAAKLPN